MLRCRTVLKRDSNSTNLTSDHPYRAPAVTCELLHLGGWVGLASLMIWVLGPPPCKAGRAGTHPFCSCTLATFECFQINFNFGGADARRLTGGGPAPQTTAAVSCPTLWSTHLNRSEPPRSYCASVRCPTSQFQIYLKVVRGGRCGRRARGADSHYHTLHRQTGARAGRAVFVEPPPHPERSLFAAPQ